MYTRIFKIIDHIKPMSMEVNRSLKLKKNGSKLVPRGISTEMAKNAGEVALATLVKTFIKKKHPLGK